jgi:hypothetical protein
MNAVKNLLEEIGVDIDSENLENLKINAEEYVEEIMRKRVGDIKCQPQSGGNGLTGVEQDCDPDFCLECM